MYKIVIFNQKQKELNMNKNEFVKLINLLIEKKLKEILQEMISTELRKQTESGIKP